MPMYSQFCAKCSTTKIYTVPISERDRVDCMDCGEPLKRLIDKPGLVYAPTASNGGTLK